MGISDVVILAGGIGERLWPLSTKEHPKQFIKVEEGLSFFQMSLRRAAALKPASSILVVTRREFVDLAADQCREFADSLAAVERSFFEEKIFVIPEPEAKHTAAAIYFACRFIIARQSGSAFSDSGKEHTVLVLTSDHIIKPTEYFLDACESAVRAAQENYFVCFAIKPDFPSTEFGYIQTGARNPDDEAVFDIAAFHEKPGEAAARDYLAAGNYWWNSGMFAFAASFLLEEIQAYAPEIAEAFSVLHGVPKLKTCKKIKIMLAWHGLENAYQKTPAIAIDRAVAEKTKRARCVLAHFEWYDAGSWDAFTGCVPAPDENHVLVQCDDCYVHSDIPVALCGVSGVTVVIKDGKALVLQKGSSPLVQEAVKQMQTILRR
ncbi:MAG: mannose-1-phosphate guanylyltransferase [Treponema sp.]|jgi:mannose-1-phosphate guanylyltransferase/mannose-6-phosphate isomerase|nr:mannose-1-phosphate guanylyltransferase [Treponema sp.]